MTLTLFSTQHTSISLHSVTFITLGTNDVNMMTLWCYCFPRYNVFGCFSLKETENLLNIWCKLDYIYDNLKLWTIVFTVDYLSN